MSGPSEDVPRWQPPARETPLRTDPWEPSADVPRWDPGADAPPRPPAARAGVGARIESDAAERRAPVERVPLAARPLRWWGAHPWAIAWVGVFLAPAAVLLLRFVDEYGYERFVAPLQWTLIALLALLLVRAVLFSARRSVVRLVLGLAAAGGALGLLLWPVTQITLGRVICPARAGADLGVRSAAVALDAWQRGEAGDAAWHAADPAPAWREKARSISLLDYRLVESGCFERAAPIDTHHTWHDFRVTIKEGERAPLSKVVVVHTAVEGDGWKITGIEGPLP
jgi:hypothetical protein